MPPHSNPAPQHHPGRGATLALGICLALAWINLATADVGRASRARSIAGGCGRTSSPSVHRDRYRVVPRPLAWRRRPPEAEGRSSLGGWAVGRSLPHDVSADGVVPDPVLRRLAGPAADYAQWHRHPAPRRAGRLAVAVSRRTTLSQPEQSLAVPAWLPIALAGPLVGFHLFLALVTLAIRCLSGSTFGRRRSPWPVLRRRVFGHRHRRLLRHGDAQRDGELDGRRRLDCPDPDGQPRGTARATMGRARDGARFDPDPLLACRLLCVWDGVSGGRGAVLSRLARCGPIGLRAGRGVCGGAAAALGTAALSRVVRHQQPLLLGAAVVRLDGAAAPGLVGHRDPGASVAVVQRLRRPDQHPAGSRALGGVARSLAHGVLRLGDRRDRADAALQFATARPGRGPADSLAAGAGRAGLCRLHRPACAWRRPGPRGAGGRRRPVRGRAIHGRASHSGGEAVQRGAGRARPAGRWPPGAAREQPPLGHDRRPSGAH